jgi:flagellar biosynthesis component FlhA
MSVSLYDPGDLVTEEIDELGITVRYIYPTQATAQKIKREGQKVVKNDNYIDKFLRMSLGHVIESLEGVDYKGEDVYTLDKDEKHILTEECYSVIRPYTIELQQLVMRAIGLGDIDRKN